MAVMLRGRLKEVRPEPAKAPVPILVTLLGTVMAVRLGHCENA